MNTRFDEELFLTSKTGSRLYHEYAENLPIIDYHCHLMTSEICEDKEFEDLGEMWLRGDHYKWRAMRTFGIDEKYITGEADYHDKYLAFASVFPMMIGNPVYIWCALELKRYFDIDEPLTADNAEEIYQRTKELIVKRHMTRRWCMEHSNVRLVSTTEDPVDDLHCHIALQKEKMFTRVITAFRPDKAMFIEQDGFLIIWTSSRRCPALGLIPSKPCWMPWKQGLSSSGKQPEQRSATMGTAFYMGLIIRDGEIAGDI